MKIGIAADRHGVALKKELIHYLKQTIEVINYGIDQEEMVDYPDYAFKVGEDVANHIVDYGILICGTGIGMSIACNKIKGIRCAKVNNIEEAKLSREHNNANVIALSSLISIETAKEIVKIFIDTKFSEEARHQRRVSKIDHYGDIL